MNKVPIISIITVTYNAESTIEPTLLSVIKQDYNNMELIIVDGKSTDNTINVAKHICNNSKIKYLIISEKDSGIYNAMNKGVKLAQGEYVLFLNSGDFLASSNVISIVSKELEGYDVVYGNHIYMRGSKAKVMQSTAIDNIIYDSVFCHQASLAKKSCLIEMPFNEQIKIVSDYDFFLRLFIKKCKFKKINIPIVYYDVNGISSNTKRTRKDHAYVRLTYSTVTFSREAYDYLLWYLKYLIRILVPRKIKNILYNKKVDYWFYE